MSSDLMKRVDEILEKYQTTGRQSYFQMKYFVINSEPTIQSKMWQCLTELEIKKNDVKNIKREIEETKDRKELLNIELAKFELTVNQYADEENKNLLEKELEIKKRRHQRQLDALDDSLVVLEKNLKENVEAMNFFCRSFLELKEVEELKPYDDLTVQQEYWNEKLSQELNMRMLLNLPLNVELTKTILSLNDSAPIKKELVNIIEKVQLGHLKKPNDKIESEEIRQKKKTIQEKLKVEQENE